MKLKEALEKVAQHYEDVELHFGEWYNFSFDLFVSADGDTFMDNPTLAVAIPQQPSKSVRIEQQT